MNILVAIEAAGDRARFGGKGANLAFLARLGANVPEGWVVPADEHARHVSGVPLRTELAAELRACVAELGGRVSVRSSATLEDAATHSFAGQFATVLNVGQDGVEDAVREVWASADSDNVRAYLRRAKLDPADLRMAVVVQRQIDSDVSGVAMGGDGGVTIEAVLGQGEGLVSGAIAPDRWEVSNGLIVQRVVSPKHRQVVLDGESSTSLLDLDPESASAGRPALDDAQVHEVAALCAGLATACGRPQDCEFAYAGGQLHVLQTRDMTAAMPVARPPLEAFTAPGPGAWDLETAHFQRPASTMMQAIFPPAMVAGFKSATTRYGLLVSHVEPVFVAGFCYMQLRPVGAPPDATTRRPPPAWVMRLLCWLVPDLRRRGRVASRVFKDRSWRLQLDAWQAAKAASAADHLRLQTVDLDTLDDRALGAQFEAACAHVARMVEQHHTYNLAAMLPIGDLMANVASWSDGAVTDAEVLGVLTGASPGSADLACEEARALGAALAADPQARAALRLDENGASPNDDEAATALETIRGLGGATGDLVRQFLSLREFRLVDGLDPVSPCLRECPALLWQALRTTALGASTGPGAPTWENARGRMRAAIPEACHAQLDDLIADARAVAWLRDERALYSDLWAWGILRTVVLAIGRRLIERSPALLSDPADLIHATPQEVSALLAGDSGPSAAELRRRAAYVGAYTTRDAPARLGPPALPPSGQFPPAFARPMRAVLRMVDGVIPPRSDDAGLRGCAAAGGVWEGPVHVVGSHAEAKDIPPGAVLVVGTASSSFTMLAPLASAVIAEGGGLLSHVAIVCREYGIPCVCGVPGVLDVLQSGQRVRVDGTRGVVEIGGLQ